MQEERIRLGSTDSVMSVNTDNFVDVNIGHHTKVFPFTSITETIDQMDVFERERSECTKYRLILTINPYCSNILFNAVTEVVRYEGTDNVSLVGDGDNEGINIQEGNLGGYTIKGDTQALRCGMIRNTEYSNGGDDGFVYHCGYDIFNNHILRSNTFKVVNNYDYTNGRISDFNTIRDFMRDRNGENIDLYRRMSLMNIEHRNYRHLYLKDDIMNITDSINTNLYENNGWFGFSNRSTLPPKKYGDDGWVDMSISKVLNGDHMACEFIEMYPDSTLYSFNPKYNPYYNRDEYNWDICLTYPYENVTSLNGNDVTLVKEGDINALQLGSCDSTVGTSGQDILLFRSLTKHNLKPGDTIKLFCKNETELKKLDSIYNVTNTGNLDGEYTDYYFYINDVTTVIDDIMTAYEITPDTPVAPDTYEYRFVKVVNEIECQYYYRKFKKLPNFRLKKEELTKDIASDKSAFEDYVENNCKKDNKMVLFNKEQYPLAFSKTVYGDSNTQVTFTDTIEIDNIVDNLGRPLSEIYVTIIKRNAGHELWYKKGEFTSEDKKRIEYSHCFSTVSCGLEMHGEFGDDSIKYRKKFGDSTTITTVEGESADRYGDSLEDDITLDNDIFYGDVVELNPFEMVETVLSDVYFRFNTEQREHTFVHNEDKTLSFIYDEILSDDYDVESKEASRVGTYGFYCAEYNADETGSPDDNEQQSQDTFNEQQSQDTLKRPEGYHYKAHYPIKLRGFGPMRQASHRDVSVLSCRPKQAGGMFIEVVSRISTGANTNDIVYLCDDESGKTRILRVNSVVSNVRFILNPMTPGEENYLNVFEIVNGLLYSKHTITAQDIENDYRWVDENGNVIIAQGGDEGRKIINYERHTITEEDVANGYTWVDENGNVIIAQGGDEGREIINYERHIITAEDIVNHYTWIDENGYEVTARESDEGRKILDYSNPRYKLRIRNEEIPSYAYKVGSNVYLWRDVLNPGNNDLVDGFEYPFANGHFYINSDIHFFLKRQDPFGFNGLMNPDIWPNDIYGNINKVSNYEYKDLTKRVC